MPPDEQTADHHAECLEIVARYVQNNAGKHLDRKLLADLAGYSVPHFHRIFTAGTGMSITEYIRRVRLKRAGRKLRIGAVDITKVAHVAGYQSHAAFSKAFRERYGLSPAAFRELSCEEATRILRTV